MELKEADGVTVVLSAIALKAGLWGIFGAIFLTFGVNQLASTLAGTGSLPGLVGGLVAAATQLALAYVFLARLFAKELDKVTALAREAEEEWGLLATRKGKEIRAGTFP